MTLQLIQKHKYLLGVAAIVLLLVAVVVWVKSSGSPAVENVPGTNQDSSGNTASEELVVPVAKEERIAHVERNSSEYEKYSIGNDSLIITFYQWETEESQGKGGGLLVFRIEGNQPVLIWESEQVASTRPLIKAMDVTGDGKNEIIALWQNGKNEMLYIYQLNGHAFTSLTPLYQPGIKYGSTKYVPLFGAADGEIQIEDLDGDQVPEVWFSVDGSYVAYKWDGSKYLKWQEQGESFGEYKNFID